MNVTSENLQDCIECLEHAYTGARMTDDIEAMERLQNALYILQHGFPAFMKALKD